MTNQEQYDSIWEERKILKEKLDRTESSATLSLLR